jgi:hypothetical protein
VSPRVVRSPLQLELCVVIREQQHYEMSGAERKRWTCSSPCQGLLNPDRFWIVILNEVRDLLSLTALMGTKSNFMSA